MNTVPWIDVLVFQFWPFRNILLVPTYSDCATEMHSTLENNKRAVMLTNSN